MSPVVSGTPVISRISGGTTVISRICRDYCKYVRFRCCEAFWWTFVLSGETCQPRTDIELAAVVQSDSDWISYPTTRFDSILDFDRSYYFRTPKMRSDWNLDVPWRSLSNEHLRTIFFDDGWLQQWYCEEKCLPWLFSSKKSFLEQNRMKRSNLG